MSKLPQIELSGDGSHTIISTEFDVAYHSHQGALEESMVVFIMAGLHPYLRKKKKEIKVFEMAFGTGLNAFLTYLEAEKHQIKVRYSGIELYPVTDEIYRALNYGSLLGDEEKFIHLHTTAWNVQKQLSAHFNFEKVAADISNYRFTEKYDVIYFDAFAPVTQGYLWEEALHQKLYDTLSLGGSLVTYCAQGKFKRMLITLGYTIERLPGPGRKHEMTRAVKLS
jgi:tRNA U34 5-methylaminomethyl-2-thiouridine-forming methyltransferase MnmC